MPGEEIACLAVFSARGGEGYIARGRLSPGLEFVEVTSIRQNGEPINASYCTVVTRWIDSENGFEIHFSPLFSQSEEELRLEIEYGVRLTTDAALEEDAAASMELWDTQGGAITGEAAVIRCFDFSVYRGVSIPDKEKQSNPLPGVCFSLYRDSKGKNRVAFTEDPGRGYSACTASGCGHERHAYLLSSPENGLIQLQGLSEGTYYLREERTPQGYESTADMLEIVVSADGEISAGGVLLPDRMISLLEQSASLSVVPAANGLMTFYEIGCKVLATALAVLLALRRYLFC